MERSELDDRDRTILSDRATRFWAQHTGPMVGDYVDFADGVSRRISHVWDFGDADRIQTSDGGSWYLTSIGTCDFSGGLLPAIPAATFTLTGEAREGAVWFFHHNYRTAHNGLETTMPFAVYRCAWTSDMVWHKHRPVTQDA
jgi:hypothetical protein